MLLPVNPLTTSTPNFCAARAVFFISSIARSLTPAGVAVAPNVVGQDRLVALVDVVQHRLADQMSADRVALQPEIVQQLPFPFAVVVFLQCLVDLKVIAPASQFDSVVAELGRRASHLIDRQVGPLAGKKRDGSRHGGLRDR